MATNKVKVRWHCLCNDFGDDFETIEDIWEWTSESCSATCPKCKCEIFQDLESAEIIEKIA